MLGSPGTGRPAGIGPTTLIPRLARPNTVVTAVAIGPLAAGDPGRYASLAAALAVLVGVMSVGASLLRVGFVADLLSRPVLVGYMAGVAVIMITGQLRRVTAYRSLEGCSSRRPARLPIA